jgi:hypothetical protein
MANRWIEFVRKWAAKKGLSYACALSQPECKAEYQAKYGNRKKLPRKTEREMMGAEDVKSQAVRTLEEEIVIIPKKKEKKPKRSQKAVATEMVSPKLKPVMERLKMLQEDLQSQMARKQELTANLRGKLSKELKNVLDEKKRLVELSRMMGEDRDAPDSDIYYNVFDWETDIKMLTDELDEKLDFNKLKKIGEEIKERKKIYLEAFDKTAKRDKMLKDLILKYNPYTKLIKGKAKDIPVTAPSPKERNKKETEMMSREDRDAPNEKKKKKVKNRPTLIIEEDEEEEVITPQKKVSTPAPKKADKKYSWEQPIKKFPVEVGDVLEVHYPQSKNPPFLERVEAVRPKTFTTITTDGKKTVHYNFEERKNLGKIPFGSDEKVITPAPKSPSPAPKSPSPAPKSPSPAPKSPSPKKEEKKTLSEMNLGERTKYFQERYGQGFQGNRDKLGNYIIFYLNPLDTRGIQRPDETFIPIKEFDDELTKAEEKLYEPYFNFVNKFYVMKNAGKISEMDAGFAIINYIGTVMNRK